RDGTASEIEDRNVAHRRGAALPGRADGQELQGRQALAAGHVLHEANVHGYPFAPLGGAQVCDRLFWDRSREVRDGYPCWDPAACLKLIDAVELSDAEKHKLFYANARRILNLRDPQPLKTAHAPQPALA